MSHTITVSLNPQQYKKMLKNKTVQLSHGNLMHSIGGSIKDLTYQCIKRFTYQNK
jgi:hypothetical protein